MNSCFGRLIELILIQSVAMKGKNKTSGLRSFIKRQTGGKSSDNE